MSITNLDDSQFTNLFPELSGKPEAPVPAAANFQATQGDANIFADEPSVTETTTLAPTGQQAPKEELDSVDLLSDEEGNQENNQNNQEGEPKKGRKAKYDFSDASGYFADRFKSGKFVPIKETTEQGEVDFIPKTPEEFDEVIDIQVNYRLEQERQELEKKIYDSKSPAWKAVMKYADLTDDPTEILPFLQGVKTIQSVVDMDENTPQGAEQILRVRMQLRGVDEDFINDQIESLRSTDKLISTAQKYKPAVLEQEQRNLHQMTETRKREQAQYIQLVNEIRDNAVKAIDTPLFGKTKLKDEEKYNIYNLIGEPSEETSGYGIYNAIDSLFENRDFETLKLAALLLSDKEALFNYISANASQKTAEGIQRQLRVAADGRTTGSSQNNLEQQAQPRAVNRAQYGSQRAQFGRR